MLTTGYWPNETFVKVDLPPQMRDGAYDFRQFYSNKLQHRKLQWAHQHGSVEMTPLFASKAFQLIVNEF